MPKKRKRPANYRKQYAMAQALKKYRIMAVNLLVERDGLNCGICGEGLDPADAHIDHIRPQARGGNESAQNLQLTHPKCNLKKGAS